MPPLHGSESHPIALFDDDDEAEVPQQVSGARDIIRRAMERARDGRPIYHIDEDEPEEDEVEHENDFQSQQQARRRHGQNTVQRNAQLHATHRLVSTWTAFDLQLKTNQVFELHEPLEICPMWSGGDNSTLSPIGAQFVEVKSIWVGKNNDHDIIIRGLPYTRTRKLHGRLELKKNEVCQIVEVEEDDERPDEVQALVEIRPEQIMKTRSLIKTNKLYPRDKKPRFDPVYNTWQKIEDFAPLTCRWKMRVEYRDAIKRKAGQSFGGSLIRISENDVEKRRDRVSDKELRESWRGPGEITLGRPSRPYSFGDMFCGAGGVSRGAVMAGLEVKIAVDHWPIACKSYARNFPGTQIYEEEMMSFINDNSIGYRSHYTDILHLSPPCQSFSPLAYIRRGKNSEANADSLLSCFHLINKLRPRLFMLEETYGLTHPKHAEFFNALIHGFTCHGYSVQWRVVSFPEYSSPSRRDRLVIFGACPGDKLPPWLPPPHGALPHRGQKHLVTEKEAIRRLRPNTDLHDVRNARPVNMPPREGNVPLPETICCGGTNKHQHFSGTRAYTLRELACLQGFPVVHRFEGNTTAIRKQIGNAFPPCVAKVFLEHLRKHLERTDGIQSVSRPPQPPPPPPPGGFSSSSSSRRRQTNRSEMARERQRDINPQLGCYNGDLDDEEALDLALQESKKTANAVSYPAAPGTHRNVQQDFVDLRDSSDEDEAQDSPVSGQFAPLMERMSIASPRSSSHGRQSPVVRVSHDPSDRHSRSRSRTLDFSPGPCQKRSLEDMHDGVEDQTMNKESPGKRERFAEPADDNDGNDGYVHVNKIPSGLLRYGGAQNSSDDDGDEYIVLGRPLGSTAAVPKREDNRPSSSDELVLVDRATFREAVQRKGKSCALSGDDGWTF